MRLVIWKLKKHKVPMMETDDGVLVCTGKQLAIALGITENALRNIVARNSGKLSLSVTDRDAKKQVLDFLRLHKEDFGVERVRDDMHLFTEDDMLTVAFYASSKTADMFRHELIAFIKENATREYVSEEKHSALVKELEASINKADNLAMELADTRSLLEELAADHQRFKKQVTAAVPDLQRAASAAGLVLQAQKATKPLRKE